MSTVVVTGASGLLGGALLRAPAAAVHRVRAVGRSAPRGTAAARVEHVRADLVTGEGLRDAVDGADVVIHAASSPRRDTERTDVGGTARLLDAARDAGVRHVVYVSIVGVDHVPVAYYRHKLAAERLVAEGGVPWSIVRGTQFHDFIDALVRPMARPPLALAPRGWLAQPVDVDEFAQVLWHRATGAPAGRTPDVAGPEVLAYGALLRAWLDAHGRRKPVVEVPIPGRASRAMRRGWATAPARAAGRLTWAAWLAARATARALAPSPA